MHIHDYEVCRVLTTGNVIFKLQVSSVKSADLESALLMLPFSDALRLLSYLPDWLEHGSGAGKSQCIRRLSDGCKPLFYYIKRCMGKCQIGPLAQRLCLEIVSNYGHNIYRCYLVYFL